MSTGITCYGYWTVPGTESLACSFDKAPAKWYLRKGTERTDIAMKLDAKMKEYASLVRDDLKLFDTKLTDYLRVGSPLISSISRHLLKSRGKRIRPTLLFLSSRAAGNYTDFCVDASLSIEFIHTATLLHDDVVDESARRRGQETVNAKWSNLISVLMGDFLFARAFCVMVQEESIELIRAISRATERVSVGELRQIEEMSNYDLSENEYLDIIGGKTASLFSVSCEVGPILAGKSEQERSKFAEFGEKVGAAFQIADDLLDFVGDPTVTGKELGNDILNGYVTLPLIHSLKQVNKESKAEITKAIKNGADRDSFEKINRFILENGGVDYAYKRAYEMAQEGLDQISSFAGSDYFDKLSDMVRFTVARDS